jgi:thioredoxin-related protein
VAKEPHDAAFSVIHQALGPGVTQTGTHFLRVEIATAAERTCFRGSISNLARRLRNDDSTLNNQTLCRNQNMKNSLALTAHQNVKFRSMGIVAIAIALFSNLVTIGDETKQVQKYAAWVVSYSEAVKQSKATGRPIMLFFSGSDWCSYCTKLTEEVFGSHEFAKWSTDHVIKVEVDFPQGYELPAEIQIQNENLKAQFGHHIQTYPTVLFINASGELLGKTGYLSGGAPSWVQSAGQLVTQSSGQSSGMLAQTDN